MPGLHNLGAAPPISSDEPSLATVMHADSGGLCLAGLTLCALHADERLMEVWGKDLSTGQEAPAHIWARIEGQPAVCLKLQEAFVAGSEVAPASRSRSLFPY